MSGKNQYRGEGADTGQLRNPAYPGDGPGVALTHRAGGRHGALRRGFMAPCAGPVTAPCAGPVTAPCAGASRRAAVFGGTGRRDQV